MRRIRTLRILSSAAAIAAACGMIGGPGLGSAQSTGGWPTFHGDSARDGFTSVSGPGTSLVANQWQLPKPTVSSPAVDAAGTAYIGDNDGKVYALSPSNPVAPKWSFATGGPVEDGPTLSPDGKTLYVGSDDGMVYALNTADGTKRWAVDMAGQIHGSPLVSSDGGTLFVSNVNGTIKGIQTSNGSVLWNNAINGAIPGSLAISPDGGSLYAATAEGYMYAIADSGSNAGKPQNPYYLDGAAAASPAVDSNGNIYIATTNGSLMSFSPGSAQATWTFRLPNPAPSLSTPAVGNGLVVFGDGDQTFYGINSTNGTVEWSIRSLDAIRSSPAISGGNSLIYVGTELGYVYALDTAGHTAWVKNTGAPVSSSPAIAADGSVWIGSQSGVIYRFHNETVPPPPSTPVPGSTPVPTATATATPSATATAAVLSFSRKSKVKGGAKQFLTVHYLAGAVIHFRIQYPNGQHQSHHGTTNAKGVLKYAYSQSESKITHTNFTASVTVKATGAIPVTRTYTILYGKIDVSVLPNASKTGHTVNLWVHTRTHTKVTIRVVSPNGKYSTISAKTGKHGWAHKKYKIASFLRRGKKTKLTVLAQTKARPIWSTKTSLTITK